MEDEETVKLALDMRLVGAMMGMALNLTGGQPSEAAALLVAAIVNLDKIYRNPESTNTLTEIVSSMIESYQPSEEGRFEFDDIHPKH